MKSVTTCTIQEFSRTHSYDVIKKLYWLYLEDRHFLPGKPIYDPADNFYDKQEI